MYCVYFTVYFGDKLSAKRYIGSSSIERVKAGYKGSVLSKKHKLAWKTELKESPSLFKTRILSIFHDKKDAINEELRLQIRYNVVKSDLYFNMALAQPNGFFGMSTKGIKKPRKPGHIPFYLGKKRPDHSECLKGRKRPEHSKSMIGDKNHMFGKTHPNKGKKINQKYSKCLDCGVESVKGTIYRYHKGHNIVDKKWAASVALISAV